MIQLRITMTGKGYHPSSKWERFADDTHNFDSITEAKAWLRDRYGTCKRVPMYMDSEEGKVGYIYSFRADDISHVPVQRWIQQDWVGFWETKPVILGRGV